MNLPLPALFSKVASETGGADNHQWRSACAGQFSLLSKVNLKWLMLSVPENSGAPCRIKMRTSMSLKLLDRGCESIACGD